MIQRIALLAGVLVLAAIPASMVRGLKVDNSIDVWLNHDDPGYAAYRSFLEKHGGDEWIYLALPSGDSSKKSAGSKLEDLCVDLEFIDGVESVLNYWDAADNDYYAESGLDELLRSEDGCFTGVLIQADPFKGTSNEALLSRIRETVETGYSPSQYALGGSIVINAALDSASRLELKRLIPFALILTMSALLWVFRSFAFTFIAVLPACLATVWILAIMTFFQCSLNMITTIIPVLIGVLSLSGALHLIEEFRRLRGVDGDGAEASELCVRRLRRPLFTAYLTTALGFVSLRVSHIGPVRDFGTYAALGMMLSGAFNFLLVPACLRWLPPSNRKARRMEMGGPLFRFLRKRKTGVALGGLAVMGFFLFQLSGLRIHSNILEFFKPQTLVARDHAFIEASLTGLSPVEILVEGPEDKRDAWIKHIKEFTPEYLPGRFVSQSSPGLSRLTLFTPMMETLAFNRELERWIARIESLKPPECEIQVTGMVPLLNRVQEELIRTLIHGFTAAFVSILIVLGWLLRNPLLVLCGMIVNLFPLVVVFGALSLFSIPLNTATVTIAGIIFGVAVDDTVILLTRLKNNAREESRLRELVERTMKEVAEPILLTTMIATIGFLVLSASSFKPVQLFGFEGAFCMTVALIGDLLILPSLLLWWRPRIVARHG